MHASNRLLRRVGVLEALMSQLLISHELDDKSLDYFNNKIAKN